MRLGSRGVGLLLILYTALLIRPLLQLCITHTLGYKGIEKETFVFDLTISALTSCNWVREPEIFLQKMMRHAGLPLALAQVGRERFIIIEFHESLTERPTN